MGSEPEAEYRQKESRTRFQAIGGWLFRYRTAIPLPLVASLLLIPADASARTPLLVGLGAAIVAAGEGLRLWAVRHIGVISRTRSDRLGPLVSTGPFAHMRNPLYLGNIALWAGFAVSARLTWLAPVFIALLALEYHAIVRWEESLLEARRGDDYRAYTARVPRWFFRLRASRPLRGKPEMAPPGRPARFSWGETLFSERGTLIAIVAGYVLLWLKDQIR